MDTGRFLRPKHYREILGQGAFEVPIERLGPSLVIGDHQAVGRGPRNHPGPLEIIGKFDSSETDRKRAVDVWDAAATPVEPLDATGDRMKYCVRSGCGAIKEHPAAHNTRLSVTDRSLFISLTDFRRARICPE
jgi:hypothetical protein